MPFRSGCFWVIGLSECWCGGKIVAGGSTGGALGANNSTGEVYPTNAQRADPMWIDFDTAMSDLRVPRSVRRGTTALAKPTFSSARIV